MIDKITRYERSKQQDYTFSILIPTWNNLDYLKNCIESINQHSTHRHQIVVFVNEGTDGTLEWLKKSGIDNLDFIHSPENAGICYAMNLCRPMVRSTYIAYMNDDMYALPGWDKEILHTINGLNTNLFMVSGTLIEPLDTGNNCVVVKDYGTDLDSFRKEDLLGEYHNLKRSNWMGSTWPPNVMHVDSWDLVGGFSTEFSPGMYSDPDFSLKLLHAGARDFLGVGSSLIYHFGSKSTRRVTRNLGRKTFISKWGISSRVMGQKYLKIGEPYTGHLSEPDFSIRNDLFHRFKRALNSLKKD